MYCKLCSIKVIFPFSFWHDFSRHYTHPSKQGCATKRRNEFLEFRIVYNMQAEERLKPQRHLFNSKPGRQAFFCVALPEEFKLLLPLTSFIHSVHFSIYLMQTNFVISIFLWYWQMGIKKRGFTVKQSQANVLTLFRTAPSISSHLAAQGITVKHEASWHPRTNAVNGLILSLRLLTVKCGGVG